MFLPEQFFKVTTILPNDFNFIIFILKRTKNCKLDSYKNDLIFVSTDKMIEKILNHDYSFLKIIEFKSLN